VEPIRAGLIGLGVMGSHHARVLDALDGVELSGIVDPARAGDVVASHVVGSSLDELFRKEVDYCVVAAPTAAHADIALHLADRGVHALVEKPLASTTPEAERISNAFAAAGLVGAVGHIERYNPAIRELRQRISEGQIGRILQVATRRQGPFPARIGDVGVVKDLATHDIDLTMWITGETFVEIEARRAFRAGRPHEDMVIALASLSGGTMASLTVNWLTPFKERVVVVTGELGTFVADTLLGDLTFYANGVVDSEWDGIAAFRGVIEGDVIRYAIPKPEPLMLEHREFVRAIHGMPADIVSMDEGLQVVSVAERILEAAAQAAGED
jgi:UDP-N-acetylglucosamine 3-dehydrogenase